ncbi:TBC-domain-containing protein [Backusella circina FSU 941]|nr:TBC-domain-containing protein [Backusella circina FSU 941]
MVFKSLLKTVTSLLDVKQSQYRILFQRETNAISLVIASCDSYELVQKAWRVIQQNIVPELNNIEDQFSKEEWVIVQMNAIVSATVTEKEADELVEDHAIRNASRLFRERFDIPERLVNYYACTCNGRQGWVYFSENYMAFYSYLMGLETKISIELKQVKAINKELPKNRLDRSLRITTKSDEEYLLSHLFKREEMYQLLLQLTGQSIHRVLKNSDSPALTNKPPAISTEKPIGQAENKSYALRSILEKRKYNQDLQFQFRLSHEEEILDTLEVSYFNEKEADIITRSAYQKIEFPGTLYQTTHFLIFQSDEKLSTSEQPICSFVLPFYAIIKCEKNNNLFEFSERTVYAAFCDTLKEGLQRDKPETEILLKKCLETCKSENIMSSTANIQCGLGDVFGYISDMNQEVNDKKINSWKWYFKENERNLTLVRQPAFARMIRSGVPNILRGEIWELCSGSIFLRFKNANLYEEILESHKDRVCPSLREIEKDLHRSLPEYEAYQNEKGIERLQRVLVAYAWKNPEIGYCQAMNIITSAMLIFMTEEQVFWILDSLVDQLCPGYYSSSMYGVLLDQIVLKEIVQDALPEIHEHLEVQDIRLEVASLPWFLTLFVNSIPLQYAFRIVDCFFLEGPKVLFQIT